MRNPLLVLTFSLCLAAPLYAQQLVHFPELDGAPATMLDGYLLTAEGAGPHPAVVFLHGCGGLIGHSGSIMLRERHWGDRLNASGVTVLMVDSFNPRRHGEMCAPDHFDASIYRSRASDAYAALRYLQSLDGVRPDRIGLMGWSEGGGALLNAIRGSSRARPQALPEGDFRAAVAVYPASCNTRRQGATWSSPTPLLVLIGQGDVWTPAEPCRELIESAATGSAATIHVYADAYHDFDWPDVPVHRLPAFKTRAGVIPIVGTNGAARADAQQRVSDFLASHLLAP
jgi:dienelactone hydrolase